MKYTKEQKRVIKLVCDVYGVTQEQLLSKNRGSITVSAARRAFAKWLKNNGHSFREIAGITGMTVPSVYNAVKGAESELISPTAFTQRLKVVLGVE